MNINRCEYNPLIVPADVVPSRDDFKVDGVFTAALPNIMVKSCFYAVLRNL